MVVGGLQYYFCLKGERGRKFVSILGNLSCIYELHMHDRLHSSINHATSFVNDGDGLMMGVAVGRLTSHMNLIFAVISSSIHPERFISLWFINL